MSTKLASVIDSIVTSAHADQQKIAQAKLSNAKQSPIISTDLGKLIVKTAELLKHAEVEITYDDIKQLMERTRNA